MVLPGGGSGLRSAVTGQLVAAAPRDHHRRRRQRRGRARRCGLHTWCSRRRGRRNRTIRHPRRLQRRESRGCNLAERCACRGRRRELRLPWLDARSVDAHAPTPCDPGHQDAGRKSQRCPAPGVPTDRGVRPVTQDRSESPVGEVGGGCLRLPGARRGRHHVSSQKLLSSARRRSRARKSRVFTVFSGMPRTRAISPMSRS